MASSARHAALAALILLGASAVPVAAQALQDASIEELMDLTVTSVGRRAQRAEDVAAATYVITRDQIRHSGLRTLPELLRLAPGVQVARAGSGKWAVSIRGFNNVFSNKVLILVDGRSIYNRSFSGVFWESLDLPLEDIERIEVIRGPGGAIWGANAVNGVLNIITASAEDSRGGSLLFSAGTFDRSRASLRYGGTAGPVSYRLFTRVSTYSGAVAPDGTDASDSAGSTGSTGSNDAWSTFSSGFRADWRARGDMFMLQGQATAARLRPHWITATDLGAAQFGPDASLSESLDLHALGRWTRTFDGRRSLQVQGSLSRARRDEVTADATEHSRDLDVQVALPLGERHALVAGGGYHYIGFAATGSPTLSLASERAHVVNVFASDEITLHPRVRATVGAKLEHDSVSGAGLLPSVRVMWHPAENQRIWASLSRARRTPAVVERSLRYYFDGVSTPEGPVIIGVLGDPAFETETLTQADAGYRVHAGATASFDLAVFYGRYRHLTTFEPLTPEVRTTPAPAHVLAGVRYANLMRATTRGVELTGEWAPMPALRLNGSASLLRLSPRVDPASRDDSARGFDGDAPALQWQGHASVWPAPRFRVDLGLYHSGALDHLAVPSFTRADARVEARLTDRLTAALSGQNLFDTAHLEFTSTTFAPMLVPRSWMGHVRWTF